MIAHTCVAQSGVEFYNGDKFIQHNDTLPYRLFFPLHFDAAKRYPLVVFLHGSGARGNDNQLQLNNVPAIFLDTASRAKYPCFLLVPQCSKKDVWVNFPQFPKSLKATDTPTTAARVLLAFIADLCTKNNIDTQRVYITGYSMGGEGTLDMLNRQPSMFAAGMAVCPVADTAKARLIKDIPLWIFHGEKDSVNPVVYSRMMVSALRRSGGRPLYTEYPGIGHRCWTNAYNEPELMQWLFKQKKVVRK